MKKDYSVSAETAWRKRLALLLDEEAAARWAVADHVAVGVHEFGHTYSDIAEMFSRAESTIRGYYMVATKVHPNDRRDDVAFGVHRAVAPLQPRQQRSWLARAADQRWSEAELRRRIAESEQQRPTGPALKSGTRTCQSCGRPLPGGWAA